MIGFMMEIPASPPPPFMGKVLSEDMFKKDN